MLRASLAEIDRLRSEKAILSESVHDLSQAQWYQRDRKRAEDAEAKLEQLKREQDAMVEEAADALNASIKAVLMDELHDHAKAQAEIEHLRGAAKWFVEVIDKAGLLHLSFGVQLGQTSWFVKASEALDNLRAALEPKP